MPVLTAANHQWLEDNWPGVFRHAILELMPVTACGRCAFRRQCPVQEGPDGYHLEHTAKQRRVAGRRREQATKVFRQRCRRRNGIESTNSALKRRTGLGRLWVRG